jgi:hypothetical protein
MGSIDLMRAMIFAGFFSCAALFRAQYLSWRAERSAERKRSARLSAGKQSGRTY